MLNLGVGQLEDGTAIGTAIATYGWSALAQLGVFTAAIYLGLGLVLLVVYPLLLIANGLKPGPFFAKAWPAIQLAFVSRSSVGTLPVTETVTERLGVDKGYAAFAIPLASTTKMDGCASIYPALAAIFGLLPAAVSTQIGSETQRPLAIVVVGGMTMTLLLVNLLPVLYSFYGNRTPVAGGGVGH